MLRGFGMIASKKKEGYKAKMALPMKKTWLLLLTQEEGKEKGSLLSTKVKGTRAFESKLIHPR